MVNRDEGEPADRSGRAVSGGADLVSSLREMLGARLVAYLAGAGDTRTVSQWAAGTSDMPPGTAERLQLAFRVAVTVHGALGPLLAQTWFQGLNPQLGDQSPARLIRNANPAECSSPLIAAARAAAGRADPGSQ